MGAIMKHFNIQVCIHQILAADIDLALICHKGPNVKIAFEQVVKDITDSTEMKARGIESAKRVMGLKRKYIS